jgi:hypothetical protein
MSRRQPEPDYDDTEARRSKGIAMIQDELVRLGVSPHSPEAFSFWRSLGFLDLADWQDAELPKLREIHAILVRLQPNSVRIVQWDKDPQKVRRVPVPRYDLLAALYTQFEALCTKLVLAGVIGRETWDGMATELQKLRAEQAKAEKR